MSPGTLRQSTQCLRNKPLKLSKQQERQVLVTVADGDRVQDLEGDKCKKVTGFGNRATDFVTV